MSKKTIYITGFVAAGVMLLVAVISLVAFLYISSQAKQAFQTGAPMTTNGLTQWAASIVALLGSGGGAVVIAILTPILARFGISGQTTSKGINISINSAKLIQLSQYYNESNSPEEKASLAQSGRICTDQIHAQLFPVSQLASVQNPVI